MLFLLLACSRWNGPAADSIPTVETSTITSGTNTDDTTPTDDTGTPTAACSGDLVPVTDPDCPEGVAALIADVPYMSVDEATAAATSGALVEVCPGRWLTNATITTGLTLRGRAGREATVLDGGGVGRVLTIDLPGYGGEVRVEGVTITGGETAEDGGGINAYVDEGVALVLLNACVLSNHAGGDGGGVAGMDLTLGPGVRIESNGAEGLGGGVYTAYGDVRILDVTFAWNTAGARGGGYYGGYVDVFATDVVFEGNGASDGGGAVYDSPSRGRGRGEFQRATFLDNVATGLGGGLQIVEDGTYEIAGVVEDGTFRGNIADIGGGLGVAGDYGNVPTVHRTTFEGNGARLGGAIGGVAAKLDGSVFVGNSATEAGGAVYVESYAVGSAGRFERNTAPLGGGIALASANLWFVGDFGAGASANVPDDVALLTESIAYGGLGEKAVVLCEYPDGCRFAPPGPEAPADAGDTGEPFDTGGSGTAAPGCDATTAALVDGVPYATIGEGVTAATSGATVDVCPGDWPANLVVTGDFTLRGAGSDATALDGGGEGTVVFVEAGAQLVISGLTVHGGYAEDGGGLYVEGVVEASGLVVEGNLASGDGGGVALNGGELSWTGGRIGHNTAHGSGGGIYQKGGSLTVVDADISGNYSRGGGGVYATEGITTVEDVRLQDNVVGSGTGGGAFAQGGTVVVRGVTVTGNYARDSAGGMYCADCSVSDVVATGNVSSSGGGICMNGGSLTTSVIAGNDAISGGGVYVFNNGLVQDTEITANQAVYGGGVQSGGATLTRVTLSGNRAVDGGGLYLYDDTTLQDTTVTGNLADRGGGAWLELGVLTSLTSDWGTGADDNVPDDVASELSSEASYGAGASFTCDAATGVCG